MKHRVVAGFFLTLLLVGLALFRDFGVSYDEGWQRQTGLISACHVLHLLAPGLPVAWCAGVGALEQHFDKDYGGAFVMPVALLEQVLPLEGDRAIYQFWHLACFLVCLLGVVAVYRLAARRCGDWRWGLVAAVLLASSPRIFGNMFYNFKDAVFMAAFAVATEALVAFVSRPTLGRALLFSVAAGFAIDVRVIAVGLPLLAVLGVIVRVAQGALRWGEGVWLVVVIAGVTRAVVLALFPWLLSDPAGRLWQVVRASSHFQRWYGDVLYQGLLWPPGTLPWHYLPVWMLITIPLLYTPLFACGTGAALWAVVRGRIAALRDVGTLQDVLFLLLLVAPPLGAITLHSIIYDSWRHFYFIYPFFILLATRGLWGLWQTLAARPGLQRALAAACVLTVANNVVWIARLHPVEGVYMNALAGSNLRERFEMDSWGLGTRPMLEHLLAHDPSPVINVWAYDQHLLTINIAVLDASQRARLRVSDDAAFPAYFLDNRGDPRHDERHPLPWRRDPLVLPATFTVFHQLKLGDEPYLTLYKRGG